MNFVHPAAFTRDKTQRDGFIRFAFGRREQAVPGGERQIRGDKRGGTEITAGGFQLPDRIPGIVRGVADRFSVVVTKKQRFNIFCTHAIIVGLDQRWKQGN